MKFIKFKRIADTKEFFILFSNNVQHRELAKNFLSRELFTPRTAGFGKIEDNKVKTFGNSVSLKVNSQSNLDDPILNDVDTFHFFTFSQVNYDYRSTLFFPSYIPVDLIKQHFNNNTGFFIDLIQQGQAKIVNNKLVCCKTDSTFVLS